VRSKFVFTVYTVGKTDTLRPYCTIAGENEICLKKS
jgi:hypothetical protein